MSPQRTIPSPKRVSLATFGLGILLAWGAAGTALAESAPASDAGCFGGLPAPMCEANTDCEGEAFCYQGLCDCSIGSCQESATRRETCTSDGCFCEDRPTCTAHNDCDGVLCFFGQCTAGPSDCERLVYAHEVCETPDSCRCERRPTCEYHDECGGVLCHRGQCLSGDTECPVDEQFYESCDDVGCRCESRDRCRSHDECEGTTLCVLNYCNDTVTTCSESEGAPYEICSGGACRCSDRNPDAGVPDGGLSEDAGLDGGSGVDGSQSDAGPDGGTASGGGGCSCSTNPASSQAGNGGLLLLLLGWGFRRKR